MRDSATGGIESQVLVSAEALLSIADDLDVLAIDIPIGLPSAGSRDCDALARQLLGPRRSSVFPAPIRPALRAASREEASDITCRIDGRKVGCQAWGIFAKIRDIDEALRKRACAQQMVREVHPEVSFRAWNGSKPMEASKKKRDGMIARRDLVLDHFGPEAFRQVREGRPRSGVADDDILDAFAALWTAERIARGDALTLPAEPPLDSAGLRMEIVY